MNTSNPNGELQKAVGAGKHARKVNNACVPCRARKIKCDAAVVGVPCSSCRSRQCVEDCVSLVRKRRTRKEIHVLSTSSQAICTQLRLFCDLGDSSQNPADNSQTPASPTRSDSRQPENQSDPHSTSESLDCQRSGQTGPDLLYLHILNDAVKETPESSQPHTTSTATPFCPKPEESLTPRNHLSTKLLHLDRIDREYLAKKGVFDLPPPNHLNALVKTYFNYVHPVSPVINRADFIRRYQSGDCSLLLLRVMMTTASIYAPANVLSACGFSSRSAAQEFFFSMAKLLYDFSAEGDPLLMLQASIILCMVLLDHPTDRDFGYWFHNAISLATKLNIRDTVFESTKPHEVSKQHRRIWWALYSLDIFHVFVDTRRSRLLEDSPLIKPAMEDDLEDEFISEESSSLLSPVTPQQKAWAVALCESSQIFGECLSIVKSKPQQNPCQIMQPLDAWRESLASKMHMVGNTGTNVYCLNIQARSYRFECILCRLIRRNSQRSKRPDWSEWAKQRFRSAILELDMIATRVLASGTIEEFPIPFVTTMTALLAFHIESALDTTETDLIRSMSLISISQTMLVLSKGREIPVLKRALPIFEEILTRNNLHFILPNNLGQVAAQPPPQDNDMTGTYASPHTRAGAVSPPLELWENSALLGTDFLGFDFLDDWQQVGQLDFSA